MLKIFYVIISVLSLFSCTNEYPIVWNYYIDGDPSEFNFELKIEKNNTWKEVPIEPGVSEVIRIRKGYEIVGAGHSGRYQYYTYPLLAHVKVGEPIEFFLFTVTAESIGDDFVAIEERPGVAGYFADFFDGSHVYKSYSKDNMVRIVEEGKLQSINTIMENIDENGYTYVDYNMSGISSGVDYGYIVQSEKNGRYHKLSARFGR